MHKNLLIFFFATLFFSGFSCTTSYQAQSVSYTGYNIGGLQPDSAVLLLIKPYSDSVNKRMNDVIGIAEVTMEKSMPEGALGNFMVDAYLEMAREKYGKPVDIALMNFGGIRINQIVAGPITRGKIYELMPFDNLLILQSMKGSLLQQFLDHIASRGGWPVAGMTMQIKDKKAIDIMIGGFPIDMEKTYTIAQSDYVANGGDNSEMIRSIPQENIGYLQRQALIDYIGKQTAKGKKISAAIENRVRHAQ